VWLKCRSVGTTDHALSNVVAGFTLGLSSNNTGAEFNQSANFSSVSSTGFTVQGSSSSYNQSSATYVGWQWKANGAGVSNTNGSITSTVSANTTAGFSVVTWTNQSSGTSYTVGHGLGVAPNMIIVKSRGSTAPSGGNWTTYHSSIGNTASVYLNLTNAATTGIGAWNNTSPTSTVFTLGASWPGSTDGMVAYCWAAVPGYSAFGSYTGNGSTDGPFVYTGFRPRWVMVKMSSSTDNWRILDTSRDLYNQMSNDLYPNSSNAESSTGLMDTLSNGFKLRGGTGTGGNESGSTYVYAAFAENPFQSSRAR